MPLTHLLVAGSPGVFGLQLRLCFQCHMAFFSECPCLSVSSFLISASVIINNGSTPLQCDLNLTYILIISVKTLFPNEVAFTDTRG